MSERIQRELAEWVDAKRREARQDLAELDRIEAKMRTTSPLQLELDSPEPKPQPKPKPKATHPATLIPELQPASYTSEAQRQIIRKIQTNTVPGAEGLSTRALAGMFTRAVMGLTGMRKPRKISAVREKLRKELKHMRNNPGMFPSLFWTTVNMGNRHAEYRYCIKEQ